MKRRVSTLLLMAFMIAVGGGVANAQEFRAKITGVVHDSSNAVVVGAKVTATNTETGATSTVMSSSEGTYTIPFLMPGKYSITAEAPKFQKYVHSGITLSLGALVTENVLMKVGATTDSVVVTAEAPLVDATTSSNGQIITTEQIEALPSNGRSPLGFVRHAYGVIPKGKNGVSQVRPFDNNVVSDISLGGARAGQNEILIDGVPNMSQSRESTYSPAMDAVQEIKADGFMADASFGNAMGGTVTMTTKGGTNKFHGTASEYNQYYGLAAKPYFQPKGTKVDPWRSNNYGGTIGGPIIKNRMFFFFAYDAYKQSEPNPATYTVPTQAELQGDFSALYKLGPAKYQLYDPWSGVVVNGKVYRTAIPGNDLRTLKDANGNSRLSPVALAMAKYFPKPNLPGDSEGKNNYFSDNNSINNYASYLGRLDHNKGNNNTFLKAQFSSLTQISNDYFKTLATGTVKYKDMYNLTVDNVHTFGPTLFLDTRAAWSWSGGPETQKSLGMDLASLGFPAYIVANAERASALPIFSFSDSAWTPNLSGNAVRKSPYTNVQFFGSLTKVWARHTVKIGPEFRVNHWQVQKQDNAPGSYTFKPDWMNEGTTITAEGKPITATNALFGGALASFMLGVPDSGKISNYRDATVANKYFALFVQDDWKLRHNLTINLGLRIENETATVEANNAGIVGFDVNAVNRTTTAAEGAYKANPVLAAYPQFSSFVFSAKGGYRYADLDHRHSYTLPAIYWGPRVGVAWSPELFKSKLAVRAGFGIFSNTLGSVNKLYDTGYSQTTSLQILSGRTLPVATLSDPFPTALNPIQQPIGSSLGVNTALGSSVEYTEPNAKQPYAERWNLDIQYQLAKGWVAIVGYTGSHSVHLGHKNDVSALPLQYLSRSLYKDQALEDLLVTRVANPYSGLLPGTGNNDKTITVLKLLKPYGNFNNSVVGQNNPSGWGNSHALNAQLSKRFSSGMQLSAVYSFSKTLYTNDPLNPGGQPWYGDNTSNYPHHLSVTGMYQLPFGKGKPLFTNANKYVNGVIGGWSLQGVFMYLSGAPIDGWGNNTVYLGGPLNWNPRELVNTQFDTTRFINVVNTDPNVCQQLDPAAFTLAKGCSSILPTGNNYRTFPTVLGRSDSFKNVDLSLGKSFRLPWEGAELQYRFEAFNAFNRAVFGKPVINPNDTNFGKYTSGTTNNDPRRIQMGLRLSF